MRRLTNILLVVCSLMLSLPLVAQPPGNSLVINGITIGNLQAIGSSLRPSITSSSLSVTYELASCDNGYLGSIFATLVGKWTNTATITSVKWYDASSTLVASGTSLDLLNVAPGKYRIEVAYKKGALLGTVTLDTELGVELDWQTLSNFTSNSASEIEKTSGSAAWNGHAFSSNSIASGADGYFQFTLDPTATPYNFAFGLSAAPASTTEPDEIDYAIEFSSQNSMGPVNIYENGSTLAFPARTILTPNNYLFKIQVVGSTNTVNFFRGGILLASYTALSQLPELYAEVVAYDENTTLSDLSSSFSCPTPTLPTPSNNYEAVVTKTLDGGYYLVQPTANELYFRMKGEYKEGDLTFSVIGPDNQVVVASTVVNMNALMAGTPPLEYGYNLFKVDLTSVTASSSINTLEVTNNKNEKWYLRFYY